MRCDRCGELEAALFRAGPIGTDQSEWWCEMCMGETGNADSVVVDLVRILKTKNNEKNE